MIRLSRLAGFKQGNLELKSADPSYSIPSTSLSDYFIQDYVNGRKYAANFAALWLLKTESSDGSFRTSARAANQATLSRLELIAATESSKAFNEGRNEAVNRYSGSIGLFKVWDATMDRGTCSFCSSSGGKTIPISQKFSFGEPGSVHPMCRCTYIVISAEEQDIYG